MKEVLTKDKCNSLRFLLLIYICIRHIGDYVIWIPGILKNGFLMCGVFLFLSGYGLMFQLNNKGKKYLDNFLKKRILKLLIPLLLVLPIFSFLKFIIIGEAFNFSIYNMIKRIYNAQFIVDYSWYVYEAIALYFIFYYFAKKEKDITRNMLLINIIAIIIMYILQFNPCWYLSLLCFNLGTYYANKNYNRNLFKFILNIIIVIMLLILYRNMDIYYIKNLLGIVVCLIWVNLVIDIMSFIDNNKNFVLFEKIGYISYESYICQGIAIILVYKILELNTTLVSVLLSLILIIIFGWIMNKISKVIYNKIIVN